LVVCIEPIVGVGCVWLVIDLCVDSMEDVRVAETDLLVGVALPLCQPIEQMLRVLEFTQQEQDVQCGRWYQNNSFGCLLDEASWAAPRMLFRFTGELECIEILWLQRIRFVDEMRLAIGLRYEELRIKSSFEVDWTDETYKWLHMLERVETLLESVRTEQQTCFLKGLPERGYQGRAIPRL
jgi:hypothetical protein